MGKLWRYETMSMKQEIWIDVDQETKEYDCEIHIHGKDLFEVLDGLSKVREQIIKDNIYDGTL